ncbi:uncharacterized protein SAPINGB_P003628 [Magnusiomyces paraingens]|uniref:Fe2OG dioxygenase domain-containing protein n=1 Tax=Magnusiomyces paraingens TaxID=2606893 RepID=A0A5E8BXS4_9ASCO|nr:uncharacterized protein SAPINGB_P003628 [Saprochaete ingens]VVT53545.1 unnamed protein product [Saprochaete ingens]
MSAFTSLPIIDISLADNPETKPKLLQDLEHALFRVGFLYLINHGIEQEARDILELAPKSFEVPQAEKDAVAMTTNPHFVGYTALGMEYTAQHVDIREQYDFGSARDPDPLFREDDTVEPWRRLKGPSPYLPDSVLPGFEKTVTTYIAGMERVASRLLDLIAECLNLPPETFHQFEADMNRLKIVKYPPPKAEEIEKAGGAFLHGGSQFQGVGPHKDSSGMFTFVLQDNVGGLEVLNQAGEWIPATPLQDSFVVNIAQGFEALTGGRCGATTHQVISPSENVTRYSIPYFHSIRLDLTKQDIDNQLSFIKGRIPEPSDLKKRAVDVPSEFIQPQYKTFGDAHLRNRVVSHKDVAKIWYPKQDAIYNSA